MSRRGRLPSAALDARDVHAVDAVLGADELALRDRVRSFIRESYLPDADRGFRTATWPAGMARELGALGVLGLHLGLEREGPRGAVAYGLACVELAAGDGTLRRFVTTQGGSVMTEVARYGTHAQREQWLAPLARAEVVGAHVAAGPDAPVLARRWRDGWVLDGHVAGVGLASMADLLVIRAVEDGRPVAFLVTTAAEGVAVHSAAHRAPLPEPVSGDVAIASLRVPPAARLPGVSEHELPGTGAVDWAAYGQVCGLVGAARAGYEWTLAHARARTTTGEVSALLARRLLEMGSAVGAATLLALHLGRTWDAGLLRVGQLAAALVAVTRMARGTARIARDVLGADAAGPAGRPVLRHLLEIEWLGAEPLSERAITDFGGRLLHGS